MKPNGANWSNAPDKPHGYTLHGDYKEAWDDTVKPTVPNQESVSVRYSIHSLGQVIRLLAPDEQPPSTCAVCGASPVRSATSLAPGLQP